MDEEEKIDDFEYNIEKKPFTKYKLDEENKDVFTIRLVEEDKKWFEDAKRLIQQPKNSTALKQLAKLGYEFVLHDQKVKDLLSTVIENTRKNKRVGITESEYNI